MKNGEDYFYNFGSEKVRKGSPSEYFHLFGGIWCYKTIPNGNFTEPLPYRTINEFRVATTNGRVLSVQF